MFGNFFKNPLGSIGKAITAPFQGAANIVTGKGNLGDLLSIASIFAPGGNLTTDFAKYGLKNLGTGSLLGAAGIGDISKMNTTDLIRLLGQGQSGSGSQYQYSPGSTSGLAGQVYPLGLMDLQFALSNTPRRQRATLDAVDALSPQNGAATYQSILDAALRASKGAGEKDAARLRASGYGGSTQQGAITSATNRAVDHVNDSQILSPDSIASRNAQIAQLLSGTPFLNTALNAEAQSQGLGIQKRAADAAYEASRPPNFLESFAQIAGMVLPSVVDQLSQQTGVQQVRSGAVRSSAGNFLANSKKYKG